MKTVRSIFFAFAILVVGASAATLISAQPANAGGGNGGGYVGGQTKGP